LFQAAEKFGVDNLQRWRQENVLLTDVNIEQLHAAITAAKENVLFFRFTYILFFVLRKNRNNWTNVGVNGKN
jgi:hypothetical protein